MKVKIKKMQPEAVIPRYAKYGDAGMDLSAVWKKQELDLITYGTGLAVEIPEGYVGLLFPRSSVYKTKMFLTNCVGVIDSGYRGEIMMKFEMMDSNHMYKVGDRIGQIIILPYPQINFEEVDSLDKTDRGHGGFGSTGT
jgi:dUTP pyrophosphatase